MTPAIAGQPGINQQASQTGRIAHVKAAQSEDDAFYQRLMQQHQAAVERLQDLGGQAAAIADEQRQQGAIRDATRAALEVLDRNRPDQSDASPGYGGVEYEG